MTDIKTSQLYLPEKKAELKEIVLSQDKEIQRLNEEIRLLRQALLGPKCEKLSTGPNPQLPLFDMPENPPGEDVEEDSEITVTEHTRKKRSQKTS